MKQLFMVFMLLPLFFSGCSMYEAANQTEADQLVAQYHEALKAKQWDVLLSLYEPSFFREHSQSAWKQELASMGERFGAMQDARQIFTQKDPRFRGDYYIYGYRLVFEKATFTETITVLKGLETDKLTIAGHVIKPDVMD